MTRFGEHPVTLTNPAGDVLHGVSFCRYPVDEPPLIEVPSLRERLYRYVWERRGWTVTAAEEVAPAVEAIRDMPIEQVRAEIKRRRPS